MPKTKPAITVLVDMDNCIVHTITLPAKHLKDCHTVIEETTSGLRVSVLRPSTIPFLQALAAKGYTLCVMTSGQRDLQELVLQKLGIRDFFQEIYGGADEQIRLDANAFVLVDDIAVEMGTSTKLALLGVPEIADLKFAMECIRNIDDYAEAKKRLPLAAAPYFVQCEGWCGAYTEDDIDVQPLTELVSQIETKISSQLND